MTAVTGDLHTGDVVAGRFLLEEKLGAGAFATVWRAHDRQQGYGVVALKLLHEHLSGEKRVIDRFAREARVLAELDHPAVARAIAWSDDEAYPYLAMQYVEGPTMRVELSRRALAGEHLTFTEVSDVALTICSALASAHSHGFVHRDLKPQNLILSREGVKVLDFGIARAADVKPEDETTIGRTLGSWQYMPPEQVRGERVDERSDLFSLGAIIFELLTLRRAFARTESGEPMPAVDAPLDTGGINSRYNLLRRIVVEPRERASRWREGVTPAMDAIVARALESEREARFSSAEEMHGAIVSAFSSSGEVIAQRPRGTVLRARAQTAVEEPPVEQPPVEQPPVEEIDKTLVPGSTRILEIEMPGETKTVPLSQLTPIRRRRPPLAQVGVAAMLASVMLTIAVLYATQERPIQTIAIDPPRDRKPMVQARPIAKEEERAPEEATPEATQEETPRDDRVREEPIKTKRPSRPQPNATESPEPSELEKMLSAARKDPENAQRIQELGAKIREDAQRLQDPKKRMSIERCATTSAVKGDLDALGTCVDRLLAAERATD